MRCRGATGQGGRGWSDPKHGRARRLGGNNSTHAAARCGPLDDASSAVNGQAAAVKVDRDRPAQASGKPRGKLGGQPVDDAVLACPATVTVGLCQIARG